MCLPQKVTVGGPYRDKICLEPAVDLTPLRENEQKQEKIALKANEETVLSGIAGNAMEMELTYSAKDAPCLELRILRAEDDSEYTALRFYPKRGEGIVIGDKFPRQSIVTMDCANSSKTGQVIAPPDYCNVLLGDEEPLQLHVFIDRCVVEVYVNNREAICRAVFPGEESVGVSLIAHGKDTVVDRVAAWQIRDIHARFNEEAL